MRKSWPSTKRKLFWMRQAASVVSDFEWSGRAPPVYLSRGVITSVEKKTWATATILVVLAMMMMVVVVVLCNFWSDIQRW